MRIVSVSLPVREVGTAAAWYRDVLDLAIGFTDEPLPSADVQVGTSRIELRHDDTAAGGHHLAFAVPAAAFSDAKAWLTDRADLLTAEDGADEFEGPEGWDSRSVYLEGPEGSILELIGHRDRDEPYEPPFTTEHLLRVSEVGLPVEGVPETAAALEATDVDAFGPTSDTFAPMGDSEGALILVPPGRPWFPTDRPALLEFITVTAVAPTEAVVPLGGAALLQLVVRSA